MSKKYTVELITNTNAFGLEFERGGVYASRALAMAAAKRRAGKSARFTRSGVDYGYRGANGMAWISEM